MPWDRDAERWGPPRRVPPGAWVVGPVVVALLQVVGSLGASRGQPAARDIDALGVALLLVGPVALALSRRWAVPGLVVSGLAVAVWLALGYPYGPVFAAYAVLTVVVIARGGRWVAWAVAGMVVAGQALRGWAAPGTGWSWAGTAGLLAWLLVALAVAEVLRGRRDRMVATIAARREERRRREGEERLLIAQELHDVVAHHMSLINVQAGVALHLAERRPESVEPALRAIRDASSEGLPSSARSSTSCVPTTPRRRAPPPCDWPGSATSSNAAAWPGSRSPSTGPGAWVRCRRRWTSRHTGSSRRRSRTSSGTRTRAGRRSRSTTAPTRSPSSSRTTDVGRTSTGSRRATGSSGCASERGHWVAAWTSTGRRWVGCG